MTSVLRYSLDWAVHTQYVLLTFDFCYVQHLFQSRSFFSLILHQSIQNRLLVVLFRLSNLLHESPFQMKHDAIWFEYTWFDFRLEHYILSSMPLMLFKPKVVFYQQNREIDFYLYKIHKIHFEFKSWFLGILRKIWYQNVAFNVKLQCWSLSMYLNFLPKYLPMAFRV